jgi:hypothetical protein
MATTTPNYGWDVPTSTDYVAQGAVAIETLGDDIDASLFSITGGKNVGLMHINTTTFTSVSSVAIDNVFTSSFANYLVQCSTTNSVNTSLTYTMRAGGVNNSSSNVYWVKQALAVNGTNLNYSPGSALSGFESAQINATGNNTASTIFFNPQLTASTSLHTSYTSRVDSPLLFGGGSFMGMNTVTTSYDGFLASWGGTATGTIRIYGYRNS